MTARHAARRQQPTLPAVFALGVVGGVIGSLLVLWGAR